jgi:hypothetical protein
MMEPWSVREVSTRKTDYIASIDALQLKDLVAEAVAERAGIDLKRIDAKVHVTFEKRDEGSLGFRTSAQVVITIDHPLEATEAERRPEESV